MRHFLMALGICLILGVAPVAGSCSDGKVPDKANPKIKICLAGDSTVQTYKPDDVITGWGQVLNQFFNDNVMIENHAIGGRSTKTFTTEGRWKKLLEA